MQDKEGNDSGNQLSNCHRNRHSLQIGHINCSGDSSSLPACFLKPGWEGAVIADHALTAHTKRQIQHFCCCNETRLLCSRQGPRRVAFPHPPSSRGTPEREHGSSLPHARPAELARWRSVPNCLWANNGSAEPLNFPCAALNIWFYVSGKIRLIVLCVCLSN